MSVVLYDESKVLPLHKHKREFNFVGKKIVVRQSWNEQGVSAVVWDAAVVLCEYLEKNPGLILNKSVLELGAGTGLVGIVAAYLGGEVTLTEREMALVHLNRVVEENTDRRDKVRVEELDWTKIESLPDQSYEVIVGADIIYIEEVFEHLIRTLIKFSNRRTEIYISCKMRYERDTRFLQLMNRDFDVGEIYYDTTRDIHIHRARIK